MASTTQNDVSSSIVDSNRTASAVGQQTTRSSFFGLRRDRYLSNSSVFSLSSINTALPEYSYVDESLSQRQSTSGTSRLFSLVPASSYAMLHENIEENVFSYPIRPDRPWATLLLQAPLSSGSLDHGIPMLLGDNALRGSIELNLDTPQQIQQIYITLKGRLASSPRDDDQATFFTQKYTIWDKSSGRNPQFSNAQGKSPLIASKGKFIGHGSFPFSVTLPTHFDLARKDAVFVTSPSAIALPSSFSEKGIAVSVGYSLAVTFVHGRFKLDSKIKANVGFLQGEMPPPLPALRREVYQSNNQPELLDPGVDPAGWFKLPKVTMHGFFEGDGPRRWIEIKATIFIGLPTSYTRGTVIPCYLELSCHDETALAHIWNTEPNVRLTRRLSHIPSSREDYSDDQNANSKYFLIQDTTNGYTTPIQNPEGMNLVSSSTSSRESKTVRHEVGRATWRKPSKAVEQHPTTRYLEGEIHLNSALHPSSEFSALSIEYLVEVLPFESPQFKVDIQTPFASGSSRTQTHLQREEILATHPVKIVSLSRTDEPAPRPFGPMIKMKPKLLDDCT